MHIGEAEITSLKAEGELFVIEADQLKQGGMQIVNVDLVHHGVETKLSVSPTVTPRSVRLPPNRNGYRINCLPAMEAGTSHAREVAGSSEIETLIRREIAQHGGIISFALFMELALYAPGLGYYEQSSQVVGRQGDFITSVSIGSVFGELLSFQFARWLEEFPDRPVLHLVEAGAHNGQLAADILEDFHRFHPALATRLQLFLVEPSTVRQTWQAETLQRFSHQVNWASNLAVLAERTQGIQGVIYSNEVLDAFPIHRVAWNSRAGEWQEIGVSWADNTFAWKSLPTPSTPAREGVALLNRLPAELRHVLPDGFTTEVAPSAVHWWSEASRILQAGRLITLDYGLTAEEFLLPQRAEGTLRTYAHHRPGGHPLELPGQQDLTAHIHLTELKEIGEAAGLVTETNTTQRQWLTEILSQVLAVPDRFPTWDSKRVRQFQTLTHPEHLGRAFRVLVQRR